MPMNARAINFANYLHLQMEELLETCYKFLRKNKINFKLTTEKRIQSNTI